MRRKEELSQTRLMEEALALYVQPQEEVYKDVSRVRRILWAPPSLGQKSQQLREAL